jgi:hypothetical protein
MKTYVVIFKTEELYEATVEAESEEDAMNQIDEEDDPTEGSIRLDACRVMLEAIEQL